VCVVVMVGCGFRTSNGAPGVSPTGDGSGCLTWPTPQGHRPAGRIRAAQTVLNARLALHSICACSESMSFQGTDAGSNKRSERSKTALTIDSYESAPAKGVASLLRMGRDVAR
jgi:hypothetical protein